MAASIPSRWMASRRPACWKASTSWGICWAVSLKSNVTRVSMHAEIVVLPGDGIGPEVAAAAVAVLKAVADRFNHTFTFSEHDIGGIAIDRHGERCRRRRWRLPGRQCGTAGRGRWPEVVRPERQGAPRARPAGDRKALGLYANLRPVRTTRPTLHASPIKAELLQGVDFVVVRELTGGIYFGDKTRDADSASDLCRYTVAEIERVLRSAFRLAQQRRGKVTSVDKANVLETSRLWRDVAARIGREEFPDVALEHQLVDSMAMHLLAKPREYDVIVTENMFGDILTDEASMLAGSLGLLPSASLGEPGAVGIYEPIHGSAPDIAGKGIANPYATIFSAAMLLRHSLGLEAEAAAVEAAVHAVLDDGVFTADLAAKGKAVSTAAATDAVLAKLG
ncbi:3-isopropylmalate dehydrogenase [Stenotrophomonas maltophilia]|nr:3-isopropylmalate dehydrogenase [Stenotrophomonas maltophilia]